MLQQLVVKPFGEESELAQFKKDVSKLEREISIKIQENQMKQHDVTVENTFESKKTSIVKMENILLPKKVRANRNAKGISIYN